jgi:type IV pilus assembly protein PilW
MTRSIHRRRTARGFSLLELLVAVTISLMLLMGVVALFVSSRASYEMTEKLSRIQENGRYALDQITNDIRAAGYQGCSRPVGSGSRRAGFALNTLPTRTSLLWNFTVPVQGFQGTGGNTFAPSLTAALNPLPSPAPSGIGDVLVIRMPLRDSVPAVLAASQSSASDPLQIAAAGSALPVGPAMISDCLARTFFQITAASGTTVSHADTGNFDLNPDGTQSGTNSLKHAYLKGAEIVPLMTVMYYIAPRDLAAANANPIRLSLYRKEGTNNPEEIAEGIDRMEVRYGVDTNNDGRVDNYVDANAIPVTGAGTPNWSTVYSVQVSLLARAPESYGTDQDAQTYTLLMAGAGGVPAQVTAGPLNDRFQRKVFTATSAVRNQIID